MRGLRFVAIAACTLALTGCKPTTAAHEAAPSVSSTPAPTPSAKAAPLTAAPPATDQSTAASVASATFTATTTAPTAVGGGELAELATLPIKGWAPMTGYSRAQFGPAWPSINGCDERNDTLQRDLKTITLSGSCEVTSGTLISPYTGATIHFVRGPESTLVQIDHVVALGDAWQTGAAPWPAAEREAFANDPTELLAVDEHSNEQKGDADAASWLPPNTTFRCSYISIQISVKAKYHLWVTQAEHDAMARVLATCGTSTSPAPTTATPTLTPPGPAATTTPPVAAPPKPTPTLAPTGPTVVHPGAFCSVAGATGISSTGKPEVCKTTATDSRLRWRAA